MKGNGSAELTDTIANRLIGGRGNDTLLAGQAGDTLEGGTGNDHMTGSSLAGDLFVYNMGDGNDTILGNGGNDVLQFNIGISLEDLSFSRYGSNLLIQIAGGGSVVTFDTIETITYNGGFLTPADIDVLMSGETITGSEAADEISGGPNSDQLEGLGGDDTLHGGTGDDVLLGGNGYDTYRVAVAGDGADTINDADGQGEIVITNAFGTPLFSVTGDAILHSNTEPGDNFGLALFALSGDEAGDESGPEEPPVGDGKLHYTMADRNVLLEYDPATMELLITSWDGSNGGSIRIQNFNSGDLGIKLIDPSQNIAPEITGFDAAATYAILGNPVTVDADITLSDDSEALHSATVTITNKVDAGEILAVDVMDSGITANYDVVMGTLTLTGEASTADYEAVLETLTYSNASGGLATLGTRTLSLTVNDGELDSEPAQASVNVTVTPSITGTDGFNLLFGTFGQDIIDAKGGNDLIHAHFGNDLVYGSAGNDTVFGGKGDDSLIGGTGNDVLQGDHGNDYLVGGADKDLLIGGHGADRFIYTQISDSTASSTDVIKDFGAGDKIDLSAFDITFDDLDITIHGPGWHGQHGLFGNLLGNFLNSTSVAVDGTDFEIQLSGRHALTETDFIFE